MHVGMLAQRSAWAALAQFLLLNLPLRLSPSISPLEGEVNERAELGSSGITMELSPMDRNIRSGAEVPPAQSMTNIVIFKMYIFY